MLKRLSLSDDGTGTPDQATSEQIEDDASESRMLRALEAMSQSAPARAQQGAPLSIAPAQAPRDQFGREARGFRPKTAQLHGAGRIDQGAKPRHRFVKDGEVPVVHMAAAPRGWEAAAAGGRGEADQARLTQQLEEQRQRADAAERARQEALLQLRLLQTKAAHAEMALTDAAALAESRLHEIAALQESLRSALLAVTKPVVAAREPQPGDAPRRRGRPRKYPLPELALPVPVRAEVTVPAVVAAPAVAAPVVTGPVVTGPVITRIDAPRRGRPRKIVAPVVAEAEPQPVEWWLTPAKTSAKAQKRGR